LAKRDYYEVLAVAKTCTQDEVKKAFRKIATEFHPDRNPGNKEAEEKMKEAAEAYSVLGDPEKRQAYDRFGFNAPGMGGGGFNPGDEIFSSFGDLFEEIFGGFGGRRGGGGGARARRGGDLRVDVELSLEEAAQGVTREIEVIKAASCDTCSGSGAKAGTTPQQCPTCSGRGVVSHSQGLFAFSTTCPRCGGQGKIVKDPCETCRGAGAVRKKKNLKIEIPAGVDEGNRVQITGEGEPGDRGGPAGDLFLVIHMKEHEHFAREGEHLLCRLPIGFAQAALGTKIKVPSLDGERDLEIPAGTQTGETFVIKNAGFPRPRRTGRGDEIVQVVVVTPKKLTAKHKELLIELAKLDGETVGDDGIVDKLKKKFRGKA
jgi:molecular chaperone DnaJ